MHTEKTIKPVKESFDLLKYELSKLDSTESDSQEKINEIIKKLEGKISEPEIVEYKSLIDQLKLATNQYEAKHPIIVSIVNDLMMKLGAIGI